MKLVLLKTPQTFSILAYISFVYLFIYFTFICSSDMERHICYVRENLSLTLREEHRIQVLENRALRAIYRAVAVHECMIHLFYCDFSLP